MKGPRRVAIWVVGIVSIAGGCTNGLAGSPSGSAAVVDPSAVTTPAVELTVYAAASLREVLAAVEIAYEEAVPESTLTIATDASSTLRTQIEQGAPADVFLSADRQNPTALVEAGLADGQAVDFAGNALTIVVPADNPARVVGPFDLARPGLKIVAAGDEVPITSYASLAMARLGALPGYPTDFAARYAANVVSNEENVRAVLAKIELGEGDAAVVYRTDATASSKVTLIELPPEAAVTATYAGVVIGASQQRAAAHAFLDWLAGPNGFAVLVGFGFLPPP